MIKKLNIYNQIHLDFMKLIKHKLIKFGAKIINKNGFTLVNMEENK